MNHTDFFKKKELFFTFILFLCSFRVTSSWFTSGKMIAIGDEGLPFYNVQRTLDLYTSYFYNTGLGISGIFNIPRIPLYVFGSLLSKLGFLSWQIQSVLFFSLIFTALYSLSLLVKEILAPTKSEVCFITSLFYLFNIFTVSQVWARFALPLIFLWAYLPLFLLLFYKYLNTGKVTYLLFFLLSSVPFSVTYLIISPIVTLWLCAFILFLIIFLSSPYKIKLIYRAIFSLILWIGVNIWWIFPFLKIKDGASSTGINTAQNLSALLDVSSYFPNSEVFRLRQLYMLGPNSPYYDFYSLLLVQNISWIIFGVAIVGLASTFYRIIKNKDETYQRSGLLFFFIVFILGWFISKGSNPPFGAVFYQFIFEKIPILQIFRNPYEKFGVVFVLGYAAIFSVGLQFLKNKFILSQYLIVGIFIYLSCIFLVKPLWDGTLFQNTTYVQVPSYYESANDYINKNSVNDERIFELPYLVGSGIKYDWGYAGEQPSEFLFDHASVSRTVSNSLIDKFYEMLHKPEFFKESTNYTNILSIMNVKYIALHKDINTNKHDKNLVLANESQEGVNETRQIILNWKDITHDRDFEKIELFSIKSESIPGRVYLSDKSIQVANLEDAFKTFTSSMFTPLTDTVFVTQQNNSELPAAELQIPEYSINKISNSHYSLKIKKSQKPFILVLANNYSDSWIVRMNGQTAVNHFIVNGYANGWFIDEKGDYTIETKFVVWPWD